MGYYKQLLKNPIPLFTRYIRTNVALRYILPKEVHVDIGCGPEKYLLRKSPCTTKIGFDQQIGSSIDKKIPLEDKSVDCISMLAAIEHFDAPRNIIKECFRILKNDGVLVITTPKEKGLWIMKLYSPKFEETEGAHKQHFDYSSMQQLVANLFEVTLYKTFEFGYNQLFICKKLKVKT